MKIKFQEGDRRVDSVVVWILIAKLADPGKVSLIQMRPEISDPVLEYAIRVVFVESFKRVTICSCCSLVKSETGQPSRIVLAKQRN